MYFWRFLRLGAIAGFVYWWLFAYVHPWLFDTQFNDLTRGLSVERDAFLVRASLYAVFGAVLVAINMTVDYAKIRMVVEDRHSAFGAVVAALRFIRNHLGQVIALYTANALAFLTLLAVWSLVSQAADPTGPSMWISFAAAQLYIVVRLAAKLQFIASEIALFQGKLAHASYTSAPVPVWPESPAAEAIRPSQP